SVYQKSGNSSLSPQVAGSITAAPAGFFSRDPSDINVEGLIAYTVPGVDATTDSYNLVVYFAGIKTATGGYTTVGFVNTKTPIDEELLTQMSATPSTTYKTTASSRPMTVGGKSYTFQARLVVGDYGYAVDVTFST
ncbi:hypothetical protein PUNSTDRAFT_131555, partial [Punctularia strigosozonata HHB-11173 SS5]|uniref:uncharacterized protein n=1 Tax=Punctularia strigosozonata (strain HHB-11173) TaxID=741275 RepID=UPI0004417148